MILILVVIGQNDVQYMNCHVLRIKLNLYNSIVIIYMLYHIQDYIMNIVLLDNYMFGVKTNIIIRRITSRHNRIHIFTSIYITDTRNETPNIFII